MNKTTLLDTIQAAYVPVETLIAPLSAAQLCATPSEGEWSIRDNMVHIAVWELLCAKWLEQCLRGETPVPSERTDRQANERIYQEHHNLSLPEVQELFAHAHQHFLHQVTRLTQSFSEEEINASNRFPWTKDWPGASLIAVIADNSYDHYRDHVRQMQDVLEAI